LRKTAKKMKRYPSYILMLEDDMDDRMITTAFFEEQQYEVGLVFLTYSGDVIPFLEKCKAQNTPLPGIILLDKNVPIHGGIDALKQIRGHQQFKHIPVVILSGSAQPAEVEECYRFGASSYISKPLTDEQTRRKIDACVRYWFEIVELPQVA
jgi:CheY-like chemotaxis protein